MDAVRLAAAEPQAPLAIADAEDPVLSPAVGAGPGLVVGEVVPGVAVVAVVLADSAPLPFAEIRAPFPPAAIF